MSLRSSIPIVSLPIACALLGPATTPATASDPAARQPNVLLITIDTLRPDALGWVDPERSTPSIDALASAGFRFPAAVAPVPLTLPSHASLLTGLQPDRHGVHDNGQVLAEEVETLAERLADAGYATAAFVSGYPLSTEFGTAQGFAVYDDAVVDGEGAWLERKAPATTESAVGWLSTAPSPWFLWVHYYDPHLPYQPPSEFTGRGDRGAYDGEVAFVDRSVGRLLAATRRGLSETSTEAGERVEAGQARGPAPAGTTLTVLAADHGESLGEHGEASHGYFIYESTLRVPLVFHFPGRIEPGESSQPVRLVDVAPTVLDLIGRVPRTTVDGISIVGLLDGDRLEIPPAAIESIQPWSSYGWAPLSGVRKGRWKYIAAPRPELYDLETDPGERVNRVEERPDVVAALRPLVSSASGRVAPDPAEALPAEVAARLRSLGYVSSGSAPARIPAGLADPKDQLPLRDLLTRAVAAIDAGDLRRAVQLCDEVLAEDPENRFALSRSGLALLRAGFAQRAVLRLRKVVELDPGQTEARTLLAEALAGSGDFEEAIGHWQELVARRPDDPELWSRLGSTLGMAGRTQDAVAALQEAVAREPESDERRIRLAFAHFANGEPESAADLLIDVRERAGADFQYHGTLGVLLLQTGRLEAATASFARSLPEQGDYAEGRFEWALWAARNQDERTARKALAEALAVRPDLRAKAAAEPLLRSLLPPPDAH